MCPSTSFERVVKTLALSPSEYKKSAALKAWVLKNKDEKYVPSELLKAWGFAETDQEDGDEAA